MELCTEVLEISAESENKQNANRKRECQPQLLEDKHGKRPKLECQETESQTQTSTCEKKKSPTKEQKELQLIVHQSPKKRLELLQPSQQEHKSVKKQKFIYGNYNQYYGYRNKGGKDYHDIRLDVFETHRELFSDIEVLDIGCNSGMITMEVAKRFPLKSIVGIDIDRGLINQANKNLVTKKKSLPANNDLRQRSAFPCNVRFLHGNYVLNDDVLLEIEREQFDVILCLSITKWIHLNFGDGGLKQAFRRMFRQLRGGGKLILEAQPFDNYGRRKKMTDTIFDNYKQMKFFPKQFSEYLLSTEVGFKSVELMGVPEHCAVGFKRPIQIFYKE